MYVEMGKIIKQGDWHTFDEIVHNQNHKIKTQVKHMESAKIQNEQKWQQSPRKADIHFI